MNGKINDPLTINRTSYMEELNAVKNAIDPTNEDAIKKMDELLEALVAKETCVKGRKELSS